MKVAAYQAPLLAPGSMEALALIREQVEWCESAGVEILCCPEGVLGGLADYAPRPAGIAIDVEGGELDRVLAPLASDTVTTILGFTETDGRGRLYNAARSITVDRSSACIASSIRRSTARSTRRATRCPCSRWEG